MECQQLSQPERARAVFGNRIASWGGGWRRWVFPGVWLVYLIQTVSGVHDRASGVEAVVGYVLVAAFATTYLAAIPAGWEDAQRRFWALYLTGLALTAAEALIAQHDAFVFFVYLSVLTVASGRRWAPAMIGAMAVLTLVAPLIFPGWRGGADYGTALAVVLVGLAMYGFFSVIKSNLALAAARAEVARLAAENERTRIARDLHDLLGHSLTTITVKAGLARRLAERGDAARSQAEITEVEQLARRTLGDVRAAVAGHREVTLAGELATAREVLRAAGIAAELPGSVDVVDPPLSELFGWVVREGVTNVVRHSRANHVWVALGPRWVEITDDGKGGNAVAGNGISGLRERVGAAGGTLVAVGALSGFRLRAEVPAGVPVTPAGPERVVQREPA